MGWQFRFSGEQLERFIPRDGADLVGFDAARGTGNELFLVEHFATQHEAEAAMAVVDVPCFVSLPRPPRQLVLFDMPPASRRR